MRRLLVNWPQKLGAVLLAFAVWLFVSMDDTNIVQRSLLVPLQVEGLQAGEIAVGVPDVVEVTVSGPETRVTALRPEGFDAILSLSGAEGEFERPVTVNLQQGVDLVRVVPSEVIGFIERERSKTVPVEVALITGAEETRLFDITAEPATVAVRGRADPITSVALAIAPVYARDGETEVTPYPATEDGKPVKDVAVSPASVVVTLEAKSVLHTRRVAVRFEPPDLAELTVEAFELSRESLLVAGTNEALADLAEVEVEAVLPTEAMESGSYTLDVRPRLPDGVIAAEALSVTLELGASGND